MIKTHLSLGDNLCDQVIVRRNIYRCDRWWQQKRKINIIIYIAHEIFMWMFETKTESLFSYKVFEDRTVFYVKPVSQNPYFHKPIYKVLIVYLTIISVFELIGYSHSVRLIGS